MAKIQTHIRALVSRINLRDGLLGNIVSTMIGIILTIGVGAFYQHHKDRQLAREMMFNVIMAGDINRNTIQERDSTFRKQAQCIDSLVTLYKRYDGDLDKAPKDSLQKYVNVVMKVDPVFNRQNPEIYMNNADVLHQFGNAGLYSDFEDFIQFDIATFKDIEMLNSQCKAIMTTFYSEARMSKDRPIIIIERILESRVLTDYELNIQLAMLPDKIKMYEFLKTRMLKVMNATEQEYKDYLKENVTEEDHFSTSRTIKKE